MVPRRDGYGGRGFANWLWFWLAFAVVAEEEVRDERVRASERATRWERRRRMGRALHVPRLSSGSKLGPGVRGFVRALPAE